MMRATEGLYLDTSLLVASFVNEPGTAVARDFLGYRQNQPWQISVWTDVEFASALAIKCRRSIISMEELEYAWVRYQELRKDRLQVLHPETRDFQAACRFCRSPQPALRGSDALHLAICERHGSCLASFDLAFCNAAIHYRIPVERLVIS